MDSMLRPKRSRRLAGFSLIELMVAVAIGLIVSLAIFEILRASEGRKRTTTALNDSNQGGAFVTAVLDRALRSAGSGLVTAAGEAYGCKLNADWGSGTLPLAANNYPAPFDNALLKSTVLAPVIVDQGAQPESSDVITVMSGNAGFSEAVSRVLPNPGVENLVLLRNTIGFRVNDLVLIGNPGATNCLVTQVSADPTANGADPTLMLGGQYYRANNGTVPMSTLVTGGQFLFAIGNMPPLGTPSVNAPDFTMFAVDTNHTLFKQDLLSSADAQPVAEGVYRMRVLYGVGTGGFAGTRTITGWKSPITGTEWGADVLRNGTAASRANLRNILAVRVALIMRSALPERISASGLPVSPDTINLFADIPALAQQVPVLPADRNFRYRVIDTVIPLRNQLLP